ncbi:PQQ-dependent dehydrogenase, methanol/ethanol family [Sphingobium sp.]|uniref:PQQ-dependent dehydrogenase, methanol/ethanol family n=1 Tax=Sphingobium sp. TaxID=1912891 RepID=UPI0028BEA4F7|nr:PQQ-dependent dehydrogenase, methanol/ethanol family [Sphingobium sp.]
MRVTRRSSASWLSCLAALALVAGCSSDRAGQPAVDDSAFKSIEQGANWPGYGRTYDESHFSPLDQVNSENVAKLGLEWSMDLPTQIGTVSAPLAVDGVLFFASGLSKLNAVKADTGEPLWEYDPQVAEVAGPKLRLGWGIRGIAYWNGKIYTGTQDGRLIAVDAKTGKPVWTAQTTQAGDGLVITGAPRVFAGKVIIGNAGADYSAVRGYVTTYDAETGKQLWRFYTVPGNPAKGFENKAMEMAAKSWTGEEWKKGGGGTVWNAITYDHELDRIYIGTGNGSPWNIKVRSPDGGDNLFLCSIVALDAKTGKYIWHYQVNPGETWDYNAAMDITLATLNIGGKSRKVMLHAPKNGFFYVIDRDTGKLISAEPFAKVTWASRIDIASGRPVENPEARFPQGTTKIWPSGAVGAHSWQPMAFSPKTGLVYIPTSELPGSYDDRGIDHRNWKRPGDYALDGSFNPVKFGGAAPPPGASFGHLQAWDPVRQRRVWSVPLGAPLNGGVAATGGNLVFQGNMKGRLVAYAADSGKELWSFDAQNGVVAQPITYLVNGRQFVTVISGVSGGAGLFPGLGGVPIWDYRKQVRRVLTFALDGKKVLPATSANGAAAYRPTLVMDPALAQAGEGIYSAKCRMCHGLNMAAAGAAPDLRQSPAIDDAGTFAEIVRKGMLKEQGMPAFQLSDAELQALRHYAARQSR